VRGVDADEKPLPISTERTEQCDVDDEPRQLQPPADQLAMWRHANASVELLAVLDASMILQRKTHLKNNHIKVNSRFKSNQLLFARRHHDEVGTDPQIDATRQMLAHSVPSAHDHACGESIEHENS
jgi:hypothetical protein